MASKRFRRVDVRLSVNADVVGVWCVHQAVGRTRSDGEPFWMVSHAPSGKSLGGLLGSGTSYSVALTIAERLSGVRCLNTKRVLSTPDAAYMVMAIVADTIEMEHPGFL